MAQSSPWPAALHECIGEQLPVVIDTSCQAGVLDKAVSKVSDVGSEIAVVRLVMEKYLPGRSVGNISFNIYRT